MSNLTGPKRIHQLDEITSEDLEEGTFFTLIDSSVLESAKKASFNNIVTNSFALVASGSIEVEQDTVRVVTINNIDTGLKLNVIDGGEIQNDIVTFYFWNSNVKFSNNIGFFNADPAGQIAIPTLVNNNAPNSGDATTDTLISNIRTRLNEVIVGLQNLGLMGE